MNWRVEIEWLEFEPNNSMLAHTYGKYMDPTRRPAFSTWRAFTSLALKWSNIKGGSFTEDIAMRKWTTNLHTYIFSSHLVAEQFIRDLFWWRMSGFKEFKIMSGPDDGVLHEEISASWLRRKEFIDACREDESG